MYTLIIDCSNFALEHGVHLVDTEGKTVSLMHLPTTELANYIVNDNRITNVKLYGLAEYCKGIKEEIDSKITMEYSNRNITVEVL